MTRLGLCSAYSFLYGVHMPDKLLDRAVSIGARTVSICDINNLYGAHAFLEAAKERNIRPVIGAVLKNEELGMRNEKIKESGEKSIPYSVFCFVENRAGFGRLCEILTERNRDREKFDPLPLLREDAGGLALASPDEHALRELAGRVGRLYAAINPSDIRAAEKGRRLGIPLAFIDDSLFLEPGDFEVHRVLRAISLLKTTGSLAPGDTAGRERILRPDGEIHRFLASWPEAAGGAEEIAERCRFSEIFDGCIFPAYGEDPGKELKRRVYEGAAQRYGELADREVCRIEYELGIINDKGFAPYFLVIDDIVKMAELAYGRHRTCGRGSGAASIVSYGLGITNVDPLRHSLYFERFLNPSRPDPPDLDIDFAWDERDDLIKAVIEKFGSDHCARIANHNMFRYRSALRETAKAYGFADAEITGMERKIALSNGKPEITIDPLWKEIFRVAGRIEGLPRGLGMHCGGLVITPGPIRRYVPVEKSAEGFPLIAWEKEGAEAAGFVKIDLLGNRSLAVIRDVLKNLDEQGIGIDRNTWRPADNRATVEALARGDSIGVFYIESPAMRQLQKKTNAGDFDHIVIHSSIIRPAANKFITEYVRRLKGGAWKPLHPRLEKILDESYGILCYQEDVSKTAVALAGFCEADADRLRKVIAKKAGRAKIAVYEKQFFDGCRKNDVSEETIKTIWEMMLSFDGYSFCKPHSASYAMVSFESAYLRVHHPAEFMAAVLSNQGGFYRPHAYVAEARRMRLFTAGPDVNASRWEYRGRSNNKYQITNNKEHITNNRGTLVIGLMAIKGLSVSGAKTLLEERERGGDFLSLDDFSRRVRLNRDDIIALCPAGVFDSVADGLPRPLQARKLLGMRNEGLGNRNGGKNWNEGLGIRNRELFEDDSVSPCGADAVETFPHSSLLIPHCSSLTPHRSSLTPDYLHDSLWEEYRALGFLRNVHPLALWKDDVLAVKNRVKALRIRDHVGRNVKMIGWPVTQKDVWTKDGMTMCFLSLEDETALYETVVFPQAYEKYNKLLFDQQPLLVYGHVSNDQGAVSLEIQRIEVLREQEPALPRSREKIFLETCSP